jgi:nucleoid-associated protein YgaU
MALGQDLQKLTLQPELGVPIVVPFNPTEYAVERAARWAEVAIPGLDAPVLQWVRGEGDTVNLELFLDVTDAMQGGVIVGPDVRARFVEPLEQLMRQHGALHRPPTVAVTWGGNPVIASAVAQRLSVTYTLFDVGGRPARATARLTLRQHTSAARQLAEAGLGSPDRNNVTTVREGDTLPAIAFREYRDARRWRVIAVANRIDDPLALTPGQALLVPKVV